ncbi:GDSL-type esterase/lipase family protein [Lacticaseibacillus sp. GG6-2]
MIFDHIEFHNVAEIEQTGDAYRLWRVPRAVCAQMSDRTQKLVGHYTSGVELRFRMVSERVTLLFRVETDAEAQAAYLFFGSFQGGWDRSSRPLNGDIAAVTVQRPTNLDVLRAITDEQGLAFSPDLVRVVLPYGKVSFVGVIGEVAPPKPGDVPDTQMLAYGSSITHGSLCLAAPYAYPFRVAQQLNIDALNLGMAGACFMEPAIADDIMKRSDWQFATLELGINMLTDYSEDVFESRVSAFLDRLRKETRPIVVTSLVQVNKNHAKAQRYREIVAHYAKPHFDYIDGLALLNEPRFISQDLVHPTAEGMACIAKNFGNYLKTKNFGEKRL